MIQSTNSALFRLLKTPAPKCDRKLTTNQLRARWLVIDGKLVCIWEIKQR